VFLSVENFGNVLKQSAVVCVLALGQLLVVLTRGIDLSVGSNVSLSAVVGAIVWRDHGSATLSVLAALGTATLVGLINGVLYVKGRLPHPFIPTLAMLTAASGLALYLAESKTIQGVPPFVNEIGSGRIASVPGGPSVGWFPSATIVVVVMAVVVLVITRRLVWGRWIYAVGGSPEAAVRNGIPVSGVLISVYAVCGFFAGVAALLTMGKGNAGSPTSGSLLELDAIAAVIIGGASFLGGRGTVLNAITGALIIAVMRNGFNLLGIDPNWQYMATGVVIVVAVELDVVRGRLESRCRSMQAAAAE
jgi:ribose transport system permease protein